MIIYLASDHAAYDMRLEIKSFLDKEGYTTLDLGPFNKDSVDYTDYANALCEKVLSSNENRGILLCGTGLGMSIAANRHKGIRAALCNHVTLARLSREHNDSNVLVMGARMTGLDLAFDIVLTWLNTGFSGEERHIRRINKLDN